MHSNRVYYVEIIRYGSEDLGVQFFGIFDEFEKIHPIMTEYNIYRGGKYPSYFVTEVEMNPTTSVNLNHKHRRVRYDIDTTLLSVDDSYDTF